MSLILCTTIGKMGYYGTGPTRLWKTGENNTSPVFSLRLVQRPWFSRSRTRDQDSQESDLWGGNPRKVGEGGKKAKQGYQAKLHQG